MDSTIWGDETPPFGSVRRGEERLVIYCQITSVSAAHDTHTSPPSQERGERIRFEFFRRFSRYPVWAPADLTKSHLTTWDTLDAWGYHKKRVSISKFLAISIATQHDLN